MTVKPDVLEPLAQADLLLLSSRAFAEPSQALLGELEAAEPALPSLLARAGGQGREALVEAFRASQAELAALGLSQWSDEFNRLFDCTVECPINESGFVRRDKGAILGDIAGFYRAFGFALSPSAHERVDHLVCELEFFSVLLVMLAQAREGDAAEAAKVTEDAIGSFAFYHLGDWLPAFCERLDRTTTLPYYRHLARLLSETWRLVCERNHLPLPEEGADREAVKEPGTPYECGMAEAERCR